MKKNGSINLLIIVGIFIAFVLGCNQEADRQRAERKEINEKLNAAAPELVRLPPKEQVGTDPYIKGKVVVIRRNENGKPHVSNMDGGQFGDAYARSPEEVETVALVECLRKQAGTYRTNENPPRELPAFSNDCDLTLIDRTIPAVVYKKRFAAQMDEKAGVTANTNSIERTAWYEINDFFKTIPRR